jgi:hypothetical protein
MIAWIDTFLPIVGLLGTGFLVDPVPTAPAGSDDVLTLELSRKPADGESVALRLSVGVLPQGARVVVEMLDGKIAGTVSPFGIRPGRKAGVYTIPVPDKAIGGDKVTLHLKILEKGAKAARFPVKGEIERAEITFMPAPSRPD